MAGGDAKSDLKWVIGIFLLLGVIWLVTGGPARYAATRSGPFIESPLATTTRPRGWTSWFGGPVLPQVPQARSGAPSVITSRSSAGSTPSSYVTTSRDFTINSGNARYTYQPNQEYIELSYRGQTPVNLAGWYLANGNANRLYEQGGTLARGTNAVAVIPPVAKIFNPKASVQVLSDLIVQPGGRVRIYTGSLSPVISGVASNARASMQLNICSGYIDSSFRSNCPRPSDWPGVNQIAGTCYDYVKNLNSCHEPKFTEKPSGDQYIDGQLNRLTSQCRAFVERNYNYAGCVAAFAGQPDFYQPEWRVYLDRPWELWAKENETVSLYDRAGHLITEIKW